MIRNMDRRGFLHRENSLPEIAQSIAYIDKVAGELSEKP